MKTAARVILLNGPGSAGKSSTARALQDIARRPLLHLSMDGFLEILPEKFADHPETFAFRTLSVDGAPATQVTTGPLGAGLLTVLYRTLADLAGAGFDVILDDVWLDGEPAELEALLAGHSVWRIGLTAPLEILEAREAARGDRMAGLSRAQLDRVHRGTGYDLLLDTSKLSPQAAAHRIAALAGL